jgi:hypothetical protein
MRYRSKREFLDDITAERDALLELVYEIPESRRTEPGVWGDAWTVCDLLAHLAEWHRMFLRWFREGSQGGRPEMPAPGFRWNETPRLNRAIWAEHRERPFSDVEADFLSTHQQIFDILTGLSERELLEPGRFQWTGKNPLSTYAGANTASHYRFGRKVLRRWIRGSAPPPGVQDQSVPSS